MSIEKAHLYIEKYCRQEGELFVDFVKEDEFLFFRNRGDYTPQMHINRERYEPTMLLVHACIPSNTNIHEGVMLTVNMNELLDICKYVSPHEQSIDNIEGRNAMRYATIYLEIENGDAFAALIDAGFTSKYIRKEFIHALASSDWTGKPCALEFLKPSFELRIWNVGQGNTNSISDGKNLTLFDFGASIYKTEDELRILLNNHESLLKNNERISLIISHWDCDHYNLLCAADDEFLQRICCVFYPPEVVTLTAKQVARRIENNCRYRVAISAEKRTTSKKCGIHVVYSGDYFTLFTGEKSRSKNYSGLLLSIYNETSVAFLTADHSNYQVWDQMYVNIKVGSKKLHTVVPHHGGRCETGKIRVASCPGIAAISVGKNSYRHPRNETVDAYNKACYTVCRTDFCKDDIVIDMFER